MFRALVHGIQGQTQFGICDCAQDARWRFCLLDIGPHDLGKKNLHQSIDHGLGAGTGVAYFMADEIDRGLQPGELRRIRSLEMNEFR